MNPYSESEHGAMPDSEVADEIVEQLVAARLISATQVGEIFRGLESGSLKARDWRLIAEKALEQEARDGKVAR